MLTTAQLRRLRRAPAHPNRLSAAIQIAETTQEQVGSSIGMTQGAISKIASGGSTSIETCQELAGVFGCTVDDLFPAEAGKAVHS